MTSLALTPRRSWGLFVAFVSLATLASGGCSKSRNRPLSQSGGTSNGGTGNTGNVGNTGNGAQGGEGLTGGGQLTAKNVCECLTGIPKSPLDEGSCASCINDASLAVCFELTSACLTDPGCAALSECVSLCDYTPSCVTSCLLPFDDGSPEKVLFHLAFDCTCELCAGSCEPQEEMDCPAPPQGGAGGQGGQGGAGGSAGGAGGQGGSVGGQGGAGGAGGAGGQGGVGGQGGAGGGLGGQGGQPGGQGGA